jgi:hypothetical protein
VRSRAQRAQARVLEEHVLQNVAANLVHDPGRSAGVEEGHGVEIGGSEGDADMAYAVRVAARPEGQAVLSANEGGRASQRDKVVPAELLQDGLGDSQISHSCHPLGFSPPRWL